MNQNDKIEGLPQVAELFKDQKIFELSKDQIEACLAVSAAACEKGEAGGENAPRYITILLAVLESKNLETRERQNKIIRNLSIFISFVAALSAAWIAIWQTMICGCK